MNFKRFHRLYAETEFDEIKVIGKDIEIDGRSYHILGMTLKEKKASLYVLEIVDFPEWEECDREKTPRESLKDNIEARKNDSFFMRIREFRGNDKIYETDGATSGPLRHNDTYEAFLLFLRMKKAGWEIAKDSPFYDVDWDCLAVTNIELRDEFDKLPEWTDDMQVLVDFLPEEYAVELPVVLECGKTVELEFKLEDGSSAICYINKVYPMDIWAEEEEKFSDSAYKERMLQHMTEVEFEQMKKQFFEVLAQQCPREKRYMVIEYECSKEVGLTFYDKEYLDTIPKPSKGSATSIWMSVRPDTEIGAHGLKLRGCMIQKPLDKETKTLEAELFSYSKAIQKRVEKI